MLDKSVRVQFIFWLNSERQDSPEKNQIYKIDESAITVYNSNKLLKKILPQSPLVCRKANRAHKLHSLRPSSLAIPTRNTFTLKV